MVSSGCVQARATIEAEAEPKTLESMSDVSFSRVESPLMLLSSKVNKVESLSVVSFSNLVSLCKAVGTIGCIYTVCYAMNENSRKCVIGGRFNISRSEKLKSSHFFYLR